MKHLVVTDTGWATIVEGSDNDSLSDLQKMVNGLITYVPCQKTWHGLDCCVNEDGDFRPELYPNYVASYECNYPLVGVAVINRSNSQGETIGLTDDDIQNIKRVLDVDEKIHTPQDIVKYNEQRKVEYVEANSL